MGLLNQYQKKPHSRYGNEVSFDIDSAYLIIKDKIISGVYTVFKNGARVQISCIKKGLNTNPSFSVLCLIPHILNSQIGQFKIWGIFFTSKSCAVRL